jgi:hypothetical protein
MKNFLLFLHRDGENLISAISDTESVPGSVSDTRTLLLFYFLLLLELTEHCCHYAVISGLKSYSVS